MKIHVVKSGESLWALSQRYGVHINRIIAVNGLESPGNLVIGQALLIPPVYLSYVVQPGATLWRIAQRYRTSIERIAEINQLPNSGSLNIGQTIFLPILTHIVSSGETLATIAYDYGTTVQSLLRRNNITDPSILYVGQRLRIPAPKRRTIDVNAFITTFGQSGATALQGVAYDLTYVSPFAYRIQSNGGLSPINDSETIRMAYATGVAPMMGITNFSSTEAGTQLAHTILNSASLQNTLITNVIDTMKSKGYQGLNIDFENVDPADKTSYNKFLQLVADRLHAEGFFVSSSLAPKTSANQPGLLYEAHDYAAHGRIMDFVVLMTYEWGYRLGPPQAISPLDQIKNVLDYAVTVIPRNKILMGFEVYARDWVLPHLQGQEAKTFDEQEAIRRAIQNNVVIQYDATAQSPYYNYTDAQGRNHEVWFEDARSARAKLNLVNAYQLRGVSYWVLEYPFPQNWALVADQYNVRKVTQ